MSEILESKHRLSIEKEFKSALVYTVDDKPNIAVVSATNSYIPVEEFKDIFRFIGGLVKSNGIEKLVFDKRKLSVFHQPSMEWYFIEWKEEMYDLGLQSHRKILPEDPVFRQSVKIGRSSIEEKFPQGKYKQMDIQYFETIDDAITK
ncbi:MAG: hypothetical protein AAF363_08585 [Bacteroidota bacterium]